MNARTMLVMSVVGSVLLLAFVVHAAAQQPELSAQEVLQQGERVEARQATITTVANGRATADRIVSVTDDREPSDSPGAPGPYVFEMHGNVELEIEGTTAYADAARYYPELDTFVAEHFRFPAEISSFATIGCSSSGNQVQVLYPNGTTVTADSVCADGAMYTCSSHQLNKSAGAC